MESVKVGQVSIEGPMPATLEDSPFPGTEVWGIYQDFAERFGILTHQFESGLIAYLETNEPTLLDEDIKFDSESNAFGCWGSEAALRRLGAVINHLLEHPEEFPKELPEP